jgi:hypothetical protein
MQTLQHSCVQSQHNSALKMCYSKAIRHYKRATDNSRAEFIGREYATGTPFIGSYKRQELNTIPRETRSL